MKMMAYLQLIEKILKSTYFIRKLLNCALRLFFLHGDVRNEYNLIGYTKVPGKIISNIVWAKHK